MKHRRRKKSVHNREETTENKRQNGNHNQGASELQKVPNIQDTTNSLGGLQTLKFQKRIFSLLNKSLVVFQRRSKICEEAQIYSQEAFEYLGAATKRAFV